MANVREWDMSGGRGFHDAVYIFPEMTNKEFEEFKGDIRERGLQVPIVTTKDGLILDGRHRWRACMELKIEPKYQVHAGDPWAYVVSANLHRRHLNDAQRAMVAARIVETTGKGGQRGNRNADKISKTKSSSEGFVTTQSHQAVTQQAAADMVNVKKPSVERASIVNQRGSSELKSFVDEGRLPIATAERIVRTLDQGAQNELVARVREGHKVRDILSGPPPLKGVTRAKKGEDKTVLYKRTAENLGSAMTGILLGLSDVTSVAPDVQPQEAEWLYKEIKKAKTVLNRIQELLKRVE